MRVFFLLCRCMSRLTVAVVTNIFLLKNFATPTRTSRATSLKSSMFSLFNLFHFIFVITLNKIIKSLALGSQVFFC